MRVEDIKRVLILGAGTMGQQIGLQCAMYGYEVVYYDLTQEILDKALKRVAKLGSWFVSSGLLTEEKLRHALARISATPDPVKAAQNVDFISESVPEDPQLKGSSLHSSTNSALREPSSPQTPLCWSPPCLPRRQEGLKK